MKQTIITISREFGSGGHVIGEKIAEKMNIPFYDKDIIQEIADKTGFSEDFVKEQSEYAPSKNMFAYAFVGRDHTGSSLSDQVYAAQTQVIQEISKKGSCVIIGRCADHILADVPGVVRVFVHAPEDFCLQEAMKVNSLSVSDVQKLIAQTDEYRAHYYKYYTGQEWKNAQNYDLSLDSSRLGFEGTVEAILSYIEVRKKFDKTM